jgi:peptidoglycan biosynthesis protein MviN/MurJ (putative lipid II flippase)
MNTLNINTCSILGLLKILLFKILSEIFYKNLDIQEKDVIIIGKLYTLCIVKHLLNDDA